MLEYMENISQSEAENIRKTIQDLFRQTCILQTKCDPVTLIQKDNPHYQVCARNREFIADYLQVLDCELVHDPQEHIFRITGDGVLTERMTLLTTKLVILMKLIYRDKIMGEGLHATTTSLAESQIRLFLCRNFDPHCRQNLVNILHVKNPPKIFSTPDFLRPDSGCLNAQPTAFWI